MKKGIEISTNLLVTAIFLIIAVLIVILLWGSFAAEAGSPSSNLFFKMFDWIAGLFGG
jgi:hypothetical protein